MFFFYNDKDTANICACKYPCQGILKNKARRVCQMAASFSSNGRILFKGWPHAFLRQAGMMEGQGYGRTAHAIKKPILTG